VTDPDDGARRPWRAALWSAVLSALVIALLGVPLGLLWRWIAPGSRVVETQIGPYPVNPQPETYVAADGWFALFGAAVGLLATIGVWWLRRRHRGPLQLGGVALGTGAAALVGWQLGRWPGHAAFEHWRHTAALGSSVVQPPDLRGHGVLLVPTFVAVIAYTLLAGWSHDPDLSGDSADPVALAALLSSDSPAAPDPTARPAPPVSPAGAPPPG
jgi:hypothetical protein